VKTAVRLSLFVILVGLTTLLAGQSSLPTPAGVKEMQQLYQAERAAALKSGTPDKFVPGLLQKADVSAKRGDAALAGGRLLQASAAFRQARWQLPYLTPDVPDHVSRVLGSLRLRHAGEVQALAFRPDGKLLATAGEDHTVRVWDLGNGHEIVTYTGHPGYVHAVAFSPDGKLLASGGKGPDIHLWEPTTGKDVRTLKAADSNIACLAFSPDGKYLVSGGAGSGPKQGVNFFDVKSGKLSRRVYDLRTDVVALAFSPHGPTLGLTTKGGEIRLSRQFWFTKDVKGPAFDWLHQDPRTTCYHIAFSPDGTQIAHTCRDAIKLYPVPAVGTPPVAAKPKRIFTPPHAPTGKVFHFTCSVFSTDGKALFAGCSDGAIYVYDLDNGQQLNVLRGHSGEVTALALGPGSAGLASASTDHTARLWFLDIAPQARDYVGHQGPVWTAAFSPDGQHLVSASGDKTARIWDTASAKVLHVLKGHELGVTGALYSPDGKWIVSSGADKLLHIWDPETGNLLRTCKGHEGAVTAVAVSPDSKTIVSGSVDRTIRFWDAASAKELRSIADAVSPVTAIAFSPDGKRIASGHVDQMVRLWEAESARPIRAWAAHGAAVGGLAFSKDGKLLATAGADQLVRVWKLDEPAAQPITFSGHTAPVSSVAFRPDGKFVVSGGADRVVKLWKLADGNTKEPVQEFRGHKDWVSSVVFSRDGYYIASASVDKTIKVWEMTSRDALQTPEPAGAVLAVAISPDGKLIASGGSDHLIRLWDRATGQERMTLAGHDGDVLALCFVRGFTSDSFMLISSGSDRTLKRWDVSTGKELPAQIGHRQNFVSLLSAVPVMQVSADGRRLAVWVPGNGHFSTLRVFDLATGNILLTAKDDNRNVYAVAFSADGKQAALGAADGSVRMYTLDKQIDIRPGGDWFPMPDTAPEKPGILALAFSPDGKTLLVGNARHGEFCVCDVAKKKVLHTLQTHASGRVICAFSDDGKRFATAGTDSLVKLWDTSSGKELCRWDMHLPVQDAAGLVRSLAFTPDGRALITGNANTTLYMLELP
jgi:WD40 repeat protein